MLKKFCSFALVIVMVLGIFSLGPAQIVAAKTKTVKTLSDVKSASDLEIYLKTNYGKLKTKLKTFDLKDEIQVIENEDQYKCFDIAIVIDWTAIEDGYYKITNSIKYTKEQKAAFEKAVKSYQKKIADAAMKAMPKKKIRGGFLDYGYEYPNIQEDYYEGAVFGWKNYEYLDGGGIFPGYYDTEVSEFNWHSFNDIDDPLDTIGLY